MILEYLNKFFVGIIKFIIYILLLILIIIFVKFDNNKILLILLLCKFIVYISLIWIIIIYIYTRLNDKIIIINKNILKYFPFIIKLRRELNFAFFLRIILSFFIFIDMFFIKILFLHKRKKSFFYFIRLVLYFNIFIFITLPFYLIIELYTSILFFLEKPLELGQYIKKRSDFLILTIFIFLLFNIKWINIIICIWIFDTIFTTYYYWFKSWKNIKVNSIFNWQQSCIALRLAFNNNGMSYK